MTDHSRHYSDDAYRGKMGRMGKMRGVSDLVASAQRLYRMMKSPDTPRWVKLMAVSSLGYLILPTDAVADLIPVAGFIDDASLIAANAVLIESFLGFLGLGVAEPASGLGSLLHDGSQELDQAPWTLLFPAVLLVATLACFQQLGDALRDAMDPRRQ